MSWIDELKIALINEDGDKIADLYDSIPHFSTLTEMKEASMLIKQVVVFLESQKSTTAANLKRLETMKKYGQGTIGHSSINMIS